MANFAGIEPCSCSDYPGHVATVIFLRGCSQTCSWCHNAAIRGGEEYVEMEYLFAKIDSSCPFISAVVVSGGEPLEQPEVASALADHAHGRGLKAGLHTSGLPMAALASVVEKFDFVLIGGPNFDPREVQA